MTRPLHPETDVQRGPPEAVSAAERERGYELRDASPRKVLRALAGFVALLLVGLAGAALLLRILAHAEQTPRAPFPEAAAPPPPHLLADPSAERAAVEARDRLDPAMLDRAIREVAARGWDDAPPSPPDAVARAHAAALR